MAVASKIAKGNFGEKKGINDTTPTPQIGLRTPSRGPMGVISWEGCYFRHWCCELVGDLPSDAGALANRCACLLICSLWTQAESMLLGYVLDKYCWCDD